jgi:uncharacterized PurR-regulated membrane protein YhhQ (DUF165 family)
VKGILALAGFGLTIPAANWMIGHVGTECVPQGPCLIPVLPGLMAPSGVLMIGLALVLRDAVHEHLGARWAVAAIIGGAALSGMVAPGPLVVASAVAFLLSEAADLAVYAPLRRRHLAGAVLASGVVGAAIDSAAFLWLAFGSLDHLAGQIVGKLMMSAIAAGALTLRATRGRP